VSIRGRSLAHQCFRSILDLADGLFCGVAVVQKEVKLMGDQVSQPIVVRSLTGLGILLRRFHDATINFTLPENGVWQNAINGKSEVICHGDAGPYNIIFRNNLPVALIDFERATPGPRVWDIAFVIYRFAPLCDSPRQAFTQALLQKIARRIRIFLNAYGFSQHDDLFNWMQLRLKTEIDLFESETTDDPIRRQKKIEAGHLALYKRDLRLIEEVSGDLGALI